MFRYVVRPFAHVIGCYAKGLRLIPATLSTQLSSPQVKVGPKAFQTVSVFNVFCVGGAADNPEIKYINPLSRQLESIPSSLQTAAFKVKVREWVVHGRVTHSDVHYLAARILSSKHGHKIAGIVARRFPVILIDEFQDTDYFLGKAILKLIAESKGFVVGDPDQAIYEFSGADPQLFTELEKLEGAKGFPMGTTQRCSQRVAAVISQLSTQGLTILSKPDASVGRTVLFVHTLKNATLDQTTLAKLQELTAGHSSVLLLARKRKTRLELQGQASDSGFPGSSKAAARIDAAGSYLRNGDSESAFRLVARELFSIAFDDEFPTKNKLEEKDINYEDWKRSVFRILNIAASEPKGETWTYWLSYLQTVVEKEVKKITGESKSLGQTFHKKKLDNQLRIVKQVDSPASTLPGAELNTVHAVKGKEAQCVVFFTPRPQAKSPCPSEVWWKISPSAEERRIAFVATSRAIDTLIICIHKDTLSNLQKLRPEFVNLFEIIYS